jgi:hypothetical protein
VAKAAVGGEGFLSAFNGGGIGDGAADEHVAARGRGRRRRCGGLGGERGRGEKAYNEWFHATSYSFTFGGWRLRLREPDCLMWIDDLLDDKLYLWVQLVPSPRLRSSEPH